MSTAALAAPCPPLRSEPSGSGPYRSEPPTSLLGTAFLAAWILLVVDGIWLYVQLKTLGRKALPLSVLVGAYLVTATVWSAALRGRAITQVSTLPFWLMACYLLVAVMVQTGEGWTDTGPAIHGFYVYYFFLLFIPLQWQFPGVLRERTATATLLLLAIGLATLGIAQHVKGDLFEVGRVISEEEQAFNLSMQGRIRANALFGHSEDLGHFLALAGGLAIALWLAARGWATRLLCGVLVILFAAGCYACYTRSAYIAFAATATGAALLHRLGAKSPLLSWYPILLLFAGLGLFFGRSILAGLEGASVLFSSSSLEDRIYMTTHYWQELRHSGVLAILIGKGWILFSHPRASLPIDNNFLAIVLNIGLLGLTLWLWATWVVWQSLLRLLRKRSSPLRLALVATYSPWLMLSIFGVVDLYQMAALLFVAVEQHGDC